MPGSPVTSTSDPAPEPAASIAIERSASSRVRPTNGRGAASRPAGDSTA